MYPHLEYYFVIDCQRDSYRHYKHYKLSCFSEADGWNKMMFVCTIPGEAKLPQFFV